MAETLGALLDEAAAALSAAGFEEPRRRARRLVAEGLGLDPTQLLVDPKRPVAAGEARQMRRLVARLVAHEPASRIFGHREFWGLDFALSADTLEPRPESEAVVEAVLRAVPHRNAAMRLLDLGTGTGCLLLALLSEFPAAVGIGIDLSSGAALTARRNAAALGLAERARFIVGDWGTALSAKFSVIVANPPYIARPDLAGLPPEVRDWDPLRALDGGADGLAAYRALAEDLARLATPTGVVALECGFGQADAVAAIVASRGFSIEAVEADLHGIARCLLARPVVPMA